MRSVSHHRHLLCLRDDDDLHHVIVSPAWIDPVPAAYPARTLPALSKAVPCDCSQRMLAAGNQDPGGVDITAARLSLQGAQLGWPTVMPHFTFP